MRTVSVLALEKAAQAWCTERTKNIEMNSNLATAFAMILDEVWSKPWLGNATTEELIQEIRARIGYAGLQYRTVETDKECTERVQGYEPV